MDNYTERGVGMTMTRIIDGQVEAIKDRKVEARMDMITDKKKQPNLPALIKKRDEMKREADALKLKLETESTVFQERKRYKGYKYEVRNQRMREMFELIAAYDRVIKKITAV